MIISSNGIIKKPQENIKKDKNLKYWVFKILKHKMPIGLIYIM